MKVLYNYGGFGLEGHTLCTVKVVFVIIPLVLFCYVNSEVSVIKYYCMILLWMYLWLDLLKGSYSLSDCAT